MYSRDRPSPREDVRASSGFPVFVPAPEIVDWAVAQFIESGAPLYNEDHQHLNFARIGALWTNVPNGRSGRRIIGQCEAGLPPLGKWQRGRVEAQLIAWFGAVPDFLLTFDAAYCAECSDAEFMALVEHELYHAGQARDAFGAPKFTREGKPAFTLRGHDVEEFVGVVRRYGAGAALIEALIEAASRPPEITRASIAQACGTCLAKAV